MSQLPARVRDLSLEALHGRASRGRLYIDYGGAVVGVRVALRPFSQAFHRVYGGFLLPDERPDFIDYHVELSRPAGVRAWLRPQSCFSIDGLRPFEPFPLRSALALFEWSVNWCFARRCNQHVLLHAGVLSLDGRAVIMAAPPGSGKSTLSAALMLSGFRLLSDEFGVLCMDSGRLLAMLKPVALKNQSVDVIRGFAPGAVLGPLFTGTHKGDVAHLAPDDASVDAVGRTAAPALVIFPAWEKGAATGVERVAGEEAFGHLAFNSFNYSTLGERAFTAVADVIEACPAYRLRYSRLDEAVSRIRALLDEAATS